MVYIDKTAMIYSMTHGASNYVFLSRPRRFGKSLLVSTLKEYFEGNRELFQGLAIEKLETEWTRYPVLHFSMSTMKHAGKEELESELNMKLRQYEKIYGREEEEIETNQRFIGIVQRAYEKTGQKVVVLIDEYDAPMLDVVHEEENLPILRKVRANESNESLLSDCRVQPKLSKAKVMRNFYSPLKDLAPYLRFVFLTGITKFSQLSIFSELNNIQNISIMEKYSTICGITEDEMTTYMMPGIECMAEAEGISCEEVLEKLKQTYDGYHFTWPSPDIYNPFSLLNAMNEGMVNGRLNYYWFGSGTPTYLIEMLRKFRVTPEKIGGQYANSSAFDAPTERMTSSIPLLYQSGYITIKGYDRETEEYLLDIPNKEVRVGLMRSLLPEYVTPAHNNDGRRTVAQMYKNIKHGRLEEALELLKAYLASVPYTENANSEGHYQSMMYVIFNLMGLYVRTEVRTATGRVDMVMRTDDSLYIFELKFNRSAKEALEQIDKKNYPDAFILSGLPIVKVGLNFSLETRTLDGWEIAKE